MKETEPVNLWKRIIVVVCSLCIISFGLGIHVGYALLDKPETDILVDKNYESASVVNKVPDKEVEVIETMKPIEDIVKIPERENEESDYYEPGYTENTNDSDTETVTEWSDEELLAIVIYQEVGGSMHCDNCRRRVADVVLNRVASDEFPDTIYEVLTQEGQYGRLYWTGIKWSDRSSNPNEAYAVERAWRIAREVLNGQHSELYGHGYIWQAGFEQGTDGFWCCGHFFGK